MTQDVVKITQKRDELSNVKGVFQSDDLGSYDFSAKVFDNPGGFGFSTPENEDGGRVSKLFIKHDGEEIYGFDRGKVTLGVGVDEDEALDIAMPIIMALEEGAKDGAI